MEENAKKYSVGNILSWAMVGLAAVIIIILLYFIVDAKPPKGARDILVNEAILSSDEEPTVWYQKRFDEPYYDQGSRYAVNCIRYIKPVNQWQITVQVNTSVFREYAEKNNLPVVPDSFENFRFRLYDDCGREYTDYQYADFSKTRHRYRRLIFDSVSGKNVSELSLDIYYKDSEEPVASLPVYDSTIPLKPSSDKIGDTLFQSLKQK